MKSSFLALLLSALVGLSACAPAPTAAPTQPAATDIPTATEPAVTAEPVHLKVGVLNFMSHLPLYIASEEGYFAEQGLDVEFVSFGANDGDIVPSLVGGQLDVGATTMRTSTFSAIEQGAAVKFVAERTFTDPEASCGTDVLMVATSVDLAALEDRSALRGMKMTSGTGTLAALINDRLFEEGGLTAADVEFVDIRDFASRVEALRAGTLEITTLSEPWATRALTSGAGKIWMTYAEAFPNFPVGTIMFGETMLTREDDVPARFLAAYLKGVERFRLGKTDENVAVAESVTQLPAEEIRRMCWPAFRADSTIDEAATMEFQEWAVQSGQLGAVLRFEQIYDPSYLEQAASLLK